MPKTKKVSVKKSAKTLTTIVYNIKGEKVGKLTLPEKVFAASIKPALTAQAVRVILENRRQGTRKTKTRSEVAGSTRKIYRQKGTGRARHGAITAPIFIGGGIAHGPKLNDFRLNLPQKMRRLALCTALTAKYREEQIKIVNNLDGFPAKTKSMVEFLTNLNLTVNNRKKNTSTLLITESVHSDIKLAGRNLPYLNVMPVSQLNTYEVLKNKNLILTKEAVQLLSERL